MNTAAVSTLIVVITLIRMMKPREESDRLGVITASMNMGSSMALLLPAPRALGERPGKRQRGAWSRG